MDQSEQRMITIRKFELTYLKNVLTKNNDYVIRIVEKIRSGSLFYITWDVKARDKMGYQQQSRLHDLIYELKLINTHKTKQPC